MLLFLPCEPNILGDSTKSDGSNNIASYKLNNYLCLITRFVKHKTLFPLQQKSPYN